MENEVETFCFFLIVHSKSNELIYQLQENPAADQREYEGHDDTKDLDIQLTAH